MNYENPRWDEFTNRLEGFEGCNFIEKIPGDFKSITWNCKGGKNKDFAIAIMKKMKNIDINKSIAFFEKHGGFCDCEIIFNLVYFKELRGKL